MPEGPSSQTPGRRAYKRYAPQIWEDHKDTIRELFVEQGKTHNEVAAILKDHHGLAVGKTTEWGFVKNIPAKEMAKMVRHRQRRQKQDGRPTRFQRDPGAGGYQVVPAAKLDAYQQRSRVPEDFMSDSSDQLLEQLQAIESSSASGDRFRREFADMKLARSKALLGVFYSFIGRFSDAERAFEVSEQFMERETCAEIKLHRTLWYAEHKTRAQDWDGAFSLMCRANKVFMGIETASSFVIDHFPGRFISLRWAVSTRTPIDKILNEAGIDDRPFDSHLPSPIPGTPMAAHSSPAAAADSVLSPQRLFPPTPRGAQAEVDIEAWRQFVEYTPSEGTTASAATN
ncbi:hypothetical protein GGTG_11157 [Gaeumannomyces tritici R3-111a-1]|uniref:Clr5 domain-containing protein n=1 Tax=Gaeumannomyces tritici (strain R3-111a-1) TaxID=644352 RepID=J3PCD4_GAET3|nr:hypothetical protein GGTG_11157 [Gaeumannomyces tritici R3-111a-1]EJT71904.1 hypothetical protein GGTG_11157 [Gaeumannomyces tritici R3-111a-1]